MFGFFPQAGASSTLNNFLFLLFKNVLCLNNVFTLTINNSIFQTIFFYLCGLWHTLHSCPSDHDFNYSNHWKQQLHIHISVCCELEQGVSASLKAVFGIQFNLRDLVEMQCHGASGFAKVCVSIHILLPAT